MAGDRRRERGFPVLVVRDGDSVLAYATYGEFRHHAGYRTTVEHTVHVAAGARRRGIGRALVVRLLELAREDGRHVMVAGIDAANDALDRPARAARLRRVRAHAGDRDEVGPLGRSGAAHAAPVSAGPLGARPRQAAGTAARDAGGAAADHLGAGGRVVVEGDVPAPSVTCSAHGSIVRARGACRW